MVEREAGSFVIVARPLVACCTFVQVQPWAS